MSKLQWPKEDRYYETGVDQVAVYVGSKAEAWNGVTAANEAPSGAEPTKIYADNIVYGAVMSPEENALTIECFTYPNIFNKCIGKTELDRGVFLSQQDRTPFGVAYRSLIKNDNLEKFNHYKLHLFPRLVCSSSEEPNSTTNDSPEQKTYSFGATALSIPINDNRITSTIVLDSRKFDAAGLGNALKIIEGYLYGTDTSKPVMPTVSQITSAIDYAGVLMDSYGRPILDSDSNSIDTAVFVGR